MKNKDFEIIARFGRGRKCKIKGYSFKTRKRAKLFGKLFLDKNPFCARYSITSLYYN